MPINKQQLEQRIARDLARKDLESFDVSNLEAALLSAAPGIRNAIQAAIRTRNQGNVGRLIINAVETYIETSRAAEAAAMLQDDTLSLAEIDRWLG